MTPANSAEQMILCMSRTLKSGDTIGLGIGSAFPVAAALLAARTHAPELYMYLPGTGTYSMRVEQARLSLMEWMTVPTGMRLSELAEVLTEGLHTHHKVFMRPAQVDPYGASNNTVIGPYDQPKIRLPGAAGIPDVTAVYHELLFYLPRHNSLTFVPTVDFVSAVGTLPASMAERRQAGILGKGPTRLISDLGIFSFSPKGLSVVSLHEGVSFEMAQERTGFPLLRPAVIPTTPPPTEQELSLIREEIDPLAIRELEMVGAKERTDRIARIWESEWRLLGQQQ